MNIEPPSAAPQVTALRKMLFLNWGFPEVRLVVNGQVVAMDFRVHLGRGHFVIGGESFAAEEVTEVKFTAGVQTIEVTRE